VAEPERRRRRIPPNLLGEIIQEVSNSASAIFFAASTWPACLISASCPNTPATMMIELSGRYPFNFARFQMIAYMADIEEPLLTIACAILSLGWGYYNAMWSAKEATGYMFHRIHPLSPRHIRIWSWAMLTLGLLLLCSGIWGILEALT
jgi:hypothetical protein